MTKTLGREFARIAPKLSEISRLASQVVSAPRHRCVLALLVCLASLTNTPMRAQTATTGKPTVSNILGSPASSSIFLDAKQYQTTGVDMCQAIIAACSNTLLNPAPTTIDARGFTGDQVCARHPNAERMCGKRR